MTEQYVLRAWWGRNGRGMGIMIFMYMLSPIYVIGFLLIFIVTAINPLQRLRDLRYYLGYWRTYHYKFTDRGWERKPQPDDPSRHPSYSIRSSRKAIKFIEKVIRTEAYAKYKGCTLVVVASHNGKRKAIHDVNFCIWDKNQPKRDYRLTDKDWTKIERGLHRYPGSVSTFKNTEPEEYEMAAEVYERENIDF